jgi:hypothetical protein
MMTGILITAMLVAAPAPQASSSATAQAQQQPAQKDMATPVLGTVTISQGVMADGKVLSAGTYLVRVSSEMPEPVVGQSPDGSRWVEFVRNGSVAGRELATVVTAEDLPKIMDEGTAKRPAVRVQELKSGEYVRVWLTNAGKHYLVHLPISR